jgi:hypothetical protein
VDSQGEQSGLLTRIATESVSLCTPMKKLTGFLELESTIRIFYVTSRWILRTTPVKGQKWLLNDEEPKEETKRERKNKI